MRRIIRNSLGWLLLLAPLHALAASGTFSLVTENDAPYGADRHYTNGFKMVWVPVLENGAPLWMQRTVRWMPWLPAGEIQYGYAFGQSVFTPDDTKTDNPPADARPYAGWLYLSSGIGIKSGRQLDQLGLTIGVIGRASLADQSQKWMHRLLRVNHPEGWDTQLGNELGIIVNGQRAWRGVLEADFSSSMLDVSPFVGAAAGNVFTHASGGWIIRYGQRLPDDFGPPRIDPASPGSASLSPKNGIGWYVFAGLEGRLVLRNLFLDGNTFRDSRSVDKRYLVGDLQFGLVVDWLNVRLAYTHIIRSREFETQDNADQFGAFSVMWKL